MIITATLTSLLNLWTYRKNVVGLDRLDGKKCFHLRKHTTTHSCFSSLYCFVLLMFMTYQGSERVEVFFFFFTLDHSVFLQCLRAGSLPVSCRQAVLSLLLKKGDLNLLKNQRSVSPLCTDYRDYSLPSVDMQEPGSECRHSGASACSGGPAGSQDEGGTHLL